MLKLGEYYLEQNLSEIEDTLEEISKEEYKYFSKTFKEENIYTGKTISFLTKLWVTIIAISNKKVYKISLQHLSPSFPVLSNEDISAFNDALNFLKTSYGAPTEHRYEYHYIWDTEWGNIILEKVGDKEGAVNLFFTSNTPGHLQLHDLLASEHSKNNIFAWILTGIIFNAYTKNLLSLSTILLIIPGIFIASFASILTYHVNVKKHQILPKTKNIFIMILFTIWYFIDLAYPVILALLYINIINHFL